MTSPETPHSNLQTAFSPTAHGGLEVDTSRGPGDSYKEAHNDTRNNDANTMDYSEPVTPKRICGITPRIFYILVAVVTLIIVGAAVGGGVGGSQASKKSTSRSSTVLAGQSATSNNATQGPITAAPTATTYPITTTSTVGPSTTLILDCPSSNNTLYNAEGALFRKLCSNNFLNANSQDVVNEPANSLNDCINFCAAYNLNNETAIAAGTDTVCNAVCWRATIVGDDFPGQCFGFATQNSSGNFVLAGDTKCDSAAWINQNLS
jgi:hypothetical protein